MRCFVHPSNDAVGVCKNCNRGVCSQCATEVDDSLACRGRCEEKVAELNKLLRKAPDAHRASASNAKRGGLTVLAMGVFMALIGIAIAQNARDEGGQTFGYLLIGLGALLSLSGLQTIRTARRLDFPTQSDAREASHGKTLQ